MLNETNNTKVKSWFEAAANVVQGSPNETIELNSPTLRSSLEDNYIIILLLFSLIIISGTVLNVLEIYYIVKTKLHSDGATCVYFINLAVADIVKCILVIPFSIMSLLFQNWFLGEFLCYFLPMMQVCTRNFS